MTPEAVYYQRDGFFGPMFHAYVCGEAEPGLLEVVFPAEAFPLPCEWCCSKCGDTLWMTEAEFVGEA